MTAWDASKFLWWVYSQLRLGRIPVYVHMLKGRCTGIFDPNYWWIILDPDSSIVRVAIHEFLHMRFPEASENEVCRKTRQVMLGLTDLQCINLLERILRHAEKNCYALFKNGDQRYLKCSNQAVRCCIGEHRIRR